MTYPIRPATVADIETIIHHRSGMMREIRECDETALGAMCDRFRPWLLAKMESREYLTWLATAPDGSVAAGAGLWLIDWPPSLETQSARRGHLLNVYTEPVHRKQGLARRLVQTALDWCRENKIDVISLHASPYGRPLYESLEFQPTNEMRLTLK